MGKWGEKWGEGHILFDVVMVVVTWALNIFQHLGEFIVQLGLRDENTDF